MQALYWGAGDFEGTEYMLLNAFTPDRAVDQTRMSNLLVNAGYNNG